MSLQKTKFVYVNGKIVPRSEAKINCFDEGILHGWAVYDGVRVYDGKILKLDEHVDRFYDCAKVAYIKIPISKAELKKAMIDTVKANEFRNAHIRPWVSYGEIGEGPNLFIQVRDQANQMGKEVKAIISAFRRTACDSIDAKIKTNSRLDICLASAQAEEAGVERAIMLDSEGFVSDDAPGASLFVVKGGVAFTPFTTNSLESVTRALIMDLLKGAGFQVVEKNMTIKDLYCADEIFSAGTAAEIRSIIVLDGRTVGEGKIGPVAKKAIELYSKYIEENAVQIY